MKKYDLNTPPLPTLPDESLEKWGRVFNEINHSMRSRGKDGKPMKGIFSFMQKTHSPRDEPWLSEPYNVMHDVIVCIDIVDESMYEAMIERLHPEKGENKSFF